MVASESDYWVGYHDLVYPWEDGCLFNERFLIRCRMSIARN